MTREAAAAGGRATPRVAVITPRNVGGETGGAERFYQGLVEALASAGTRVDHLAIPADERTFQAVEETLLRFYDLDLSAYDGVISTKTPSYCLRHPNHVCYLVHTMRVFYDMFEREWPSPNEEQRRQRALITELDTGFLARARRVFTIGHEVTDRLSRWNGIESEVLHPGLGFDRFREGRFDYVFTPSRLHRWKRIDLIILAMRAVRAPVQLRVAGVGEDAERLREMAEGDPRIQFLGYLTDDELVEQYANALLVPFCPTGEDYGYVTLEAFRSGKPVITCRDSGEPARFVQDGSTGFVCPPDPSAIAARIDALYADQQLARDMGSRGRASIAHIAWKRVADSLLGALDLSCGGH
jgi:glycosyltransferase involved in cell wall biosynthesis